MLKTLREIIFALAPNRVKEHMTSVYCMNQAWDAYQKGDTKSAYQWQEASKYVPEN